jgi:hypothetical protein
LLDKGVDVKATGLCFRGYQNSTSFNFTLFPSATALIRAYYRKDLYYTNMILSFGAKVINIVHIPADDLTIDMLSILLRHGLNPNMPAAGYTFFDNCLGRNISTRILEILYDEGANLDAISRNTLVSHVLRNHRLLIYMLRHPTRPLDLNNKYYHPGLGRQTLSEIIDLELGRGSIQTFLVMGSAREILTAYKVEETRTEMRKHYRRG